MKLIFIALLCVLSIALPDQDKVNAPVTHSFYEGNDKLNHIFWISIHHQFNSENPLCIYSSKIKPLTSPLSCMV